MTKNKQQSPVERQIFLKGRLIKNLQRDISAVRKNAAEEVKRIQFRIKMAQTLMNALQKGR